MCYRGVEAFQVIREHISPLGQQEYRSSFFEYNHDKFFYYTPRGV